MQFIVSLRYLTGLEKLGSMVVEHFEQTVHLLSGVRAAVLDNKGIRPYRTFSVMNLPLGRWMQIPRMEVKTEEWLNAPLHAVRRIAIGVPHQSLGSLDSEKRPLIEIPSIRIL
jgi:hypothetical protein